MTSDPWYWAYTVMGGVLVWIGDTPAIFWSVVLFAAALYSYVPPDTQEDESEA